MGKTCKILEDCPCPDISDDMFGTPLPPDVCLKPIKIMKATLKKHKVNHELLRKN
jgi:hypothetical protein